MPFILVSPQTPAGEVWSVDALAALMNHLEGTPRVDRSREYLTGISMGAFGACRRRWPNVSRRVATECG